MLASAGASSYPRQASSYPICRMTSSAFAMQRSVSAQLEGVRGGQPPAARSRATPLSRIDESTESVLRPDDVQRAPTSSSLYKIFYVQTMNGSWQCQVCGAAIRCNDSSTGNLGKHLETQHCNYHRAIHAPGLDHGTKRNQLEDMAKDAETRRSLNDRGKITRWAKRLRLDPQAAASEATWLLWLTKRGVAYDAIQDPLFHLARAVCAAPHVCLAYDS